MIRFYNFFNSNFQSSLFGVCSFGKPKSAIIYWNMLLKLRLLSTEQGGKQIVFLPFRDRTEMKTMPWGKEIHRAVPTWSCPAQLWHQRNFYRLQNCRICPRILTQPQAEVACAFPSQDVTCQEMCLCQLLLLKAQACNCLASFSWLLLSEFLFCLSKSDLKENKTNRSREELVCLLPREVKESQSAP